MTSRDRARALREQLTGDYIFSGAVSSELDEIEDALNAAAAEAASAEREACAAIADRYAARYHEAIFDHGVLYERYLAANDACVDIADKIRSRGQGKVNGRFY